MFSKIKFLSGAGQMPAIGVLEFREF